MKTIIGIIKKHVGRRSIVVKDVETGKEITLDRMAVRRIIEHRPDGMVCEFEVDGGMCE